MAEIVFTEELIGSGAPIEGNENMVRARTSGQNSLGDDVMFESEVLLDGDKFTETGSIRYGDRGSIKFDTVGNGHMGGSAVPGLNHGSVIWKVTDGEGEFEGASGLITSNFTFSEQGEVIDNHVVRIFTN